MKQFNKQTFARQAGRGWIPVCRDIGLPGESTGAAQESFAAGSGPGGADMVAIHARAPWAQSRVGRAITPAGMVRFCDQLALSGNVRAACAHAGFSANGAYKLRRRDARFAAAWDAALVLARGHAEAVLADRALNGVDEPIFYHGEEIARRRRYDARLLLAHLARLDARCGDEGAARLAGRFDELLAAMAGYGPAPGEHEGTGHKGAETGDPDLGAGRQAYAAWRRQQAEQAAQEAEEEGEAWDEAGQDPILAAGARALEQADGEWSAWLRDVHGAVDDMSGDFEASDFEASDFGASDFEFGCNGASEGEIGDDGQVAGDRPGDPSCPVPGDPPLKNQKRGGPACGS